ncbi:MAG: hypothetical protein F4W95_01495 [Chloroflexi bacterium]|nr:hypothetical protein [Chloroflexota bacterium]
MLDTLRKPLGVLALLAALVMLCAHNVAVAYSLSTAVWHIVAIIVIVPLALTILFNVADSLRVRRDPSAHLGQLPRDAITVVVAFVLIMFLHNYLLFAVPHAEVNSALWKYLDPAAVVILSWEGIALLRSPSRSD